jgi:hypothetical protein
MNVDKIELVFLYLHCKKCGYESQGLVKKKVSKNDLLGLGHLLGIPLHNPLFIPLPRPFFFGFAFVMFLFSLGGGDFGFDQAFVVAIDLKHHRRHLGAGHGPHNFVDFAFVEQQQAGSFFRMIAVTGKGIGGNVHPHGI